MTKSFFFYGVYDGNESDEMWKILHDHFEKLAGEDDDAETENYVSERKAVKRKEEVRD